MSEMVERVARAIDPAAFDRDRFNSMADIYTKSGDFEKGMEQVKQKARAAIEAMREPTEVMVVRGAKQLGEAVQWDRLGDLPRRTYRTGAMAVFDAMIDESLK